MNRVNFFIASGVVFLLCQGCASTPSSDGRQHGEARLVDLGNGICQQSNGLMWQVEQTAMVASGQEALDYVTNLTLGNHSDWRLPSKAELYELCVIFDMKDTGDCPLTLKGSYWLTNGETQSGEWQAYPLCGGSEFEYLKGKAGRVRAVRP